ncbi:hypothetical protein B0H13DRAFT_2304236 [Mycena leptocephala]|nr:hypothetical protein B0H13DRAFT_2304236 [Mycena leptocephala]
MQPLLAAVPRRVPREEDPQYQPPPLPLEVIWSDRVPWIKPPPVERAEGGGKWGKWVQYENSSTDPPSFYIRKRALTWRPQSKHSVWYDRAHRRELYLRADFQVPLGVLEVDLFGCPAPRDLYYESEQLEGVFTPVLRHPSHWMYRTRESPRDIGRMLARPATDRLPMKGISPPTQRLAAYDSDEDDDDGGDSDDDEPPPAPVVRVVESTELVVDGPESSSSAAPHTHAVGDEDAEGRLKPQDQEKQMEVESSSPAAPHTHAVRDEDTEGWLKPQDQEKQMEVDIEDNAGMDANAGVDDDAEMDEDLVSLGEESDDELTCPPKEAEEAESSPPQGCAVGDEDEEGRERAQEEQMEVDGAESSSAAPQTDKGKGRAMLPAWLPTIPTATPSLPLPTAPSLPLLASPPTLSGAPPTLLPLLAAVQPLPLPVALPIRPLPASLPAFPAALLFPLPAALPFPLPAALPFLLPAALPLPLPAALPSTATAPTTRPLPASPLALPAAPPLALSASPPSAGISSM